MSTWRGLAGKLTLMLRPVASVAATGLHSAWLVAIALGARLVVASVVALVMVFSVDKDRRVDAIKEVPAVLDALLGRRR